MNILHILGNGFDLNLGMKTSYADFYKYYKATNSKSNSIAKLKSSISNNFDTWSDLELAFGDYTKNLESIEEFDEVFEDIGDKLAEYLQNEEKLFDSSKIDSKVFFDYLTYPEKQLLKADANKISSFKDKWENTQWNISITTLNYTNTVEKILGDSKGTFKIGNNKKGYSIIFQGVEHIHGFVNERMVMGVNDVSQVANKSFHKSIDFLEAFVKNDCNKAQKHAGEELFKNQIAKADLICIFGSSIGKTDNLWWNLIGEQLKNKCNVIIYYKSGKIPQRREYKKARVERKVKESFLSKTSLSDEEKDSVYNKIFVSINSNMFKLNGTIEYISI